MTLHEFYSKNLETSFEDKVKYYLFLPHLSLYNCEELSYLLKDSSTFDIDGEHIIIETLSAFMRYKAMLESYDWVESISNHPDKIDRCVIKLVPIDLKAYSEFLKGNYSKMYENPEKMLKHYLNNGTDNTKLKVTRIVKVLTHAKDYQEFLEEYLNLKRGILNDIELDSKI